MSKKVKFLILALVGLVVIVAIAIPVLNWYSKQEYVIVSNKFNITVKSDADLIYFDDDDNYVHAAYCVSDDDYQKMLDEIKNAGYKETDEITIDTELEWIPADRIVKSYGLVLYGEGTPNIFVTETQNGLVELYFVKQ